MLYNKKGELTTKQLVTLIILIISFVVILFLIFRLNIQDVTSKELCRNSVITKGNAVVPGSPLNCKLNYICLSKTGTCDKTDFVDQIIKVETDTDVYEVLADKMAECWWMFGEGKVEYVDGAFLTELTCSLCSQVYFDKSIEEIFGGTTFNQEDLYDYIAKTKYDQTREYDEYLYEGLDVNTGADLVQQLRAKNLPTKFMDVDLTKPNLIMMGIYSELGTFEWLVFGTVLTAATVLTAGAALKIVAIAGSGVIAAGAGALAGLVSFKVVLYTGLLGGTLMGMSAEGESGNEFLRPLMIEKDSGPFKTLGCYRLATTS